MTTAATVPETPDQVLEFTLEDERYCVEIETIDEIVTLDEITTVPDTPPQVVGVMDLRGKPTTIVDPAFVFDLDVTGDRRQVVIFDGDHDDRIGWLVDRVHRVATLGESVIEHTTDSQYVIGLVTGDERFTIWIDPAPINGSIST